MKNIYEILKSLGVDFDETKKSSFEKEFIESYKTINDYTKQKEKLEKVQADFDEAKAQADKLNEDIKKMDIEGSKETIEALQKKVKEYEETEKSRKENEEKEKADKEMTEKITAIFGDKKFTSDYVRNGIVADIKSQFAKDNTKGLEKIFEELTKDKDGIFVNEQSENLKLPPIGGGSGGINDNDARKIMGLEPLK